MNWHGWTLLGVLPTRTSTSSWSLPAALLEITSPSTAPPLELGWLPAPPLELGWLPAPPLEMGWLLSPTMQG